MTKVTDMTLAVPISTDVGYFVAVARATVKIAAAPAGRIPLQAFPQKSE